MSAPPRDRLREEIARAEALVATLDSELESARVRLQTLRDQLAKSRTLLTPPSDPSPIPHMCAPDTPAEKVRLFRQLFRGREDVFPKLWLNPKTGKKGYAPACSNEWVRGICEKPRKRRRRPRLSSRRRKIDRGGNRRPYAVQPGSIRDS